MSEEIKGLVEAQGRAFEEFKSKMDAKLEGKADAVIDAEIKKLNDALDDLGGKLKAIETKAARPGAAAEEAADEYKSAYRKWMATGDETEIKTLQSNVATDGGFAVPKVVDSAIIKRLVDISPVRSVATVVQVGTADYNRLVNTNGTASGWVGETQSRPETGTPKLVNIKPTMGELYANPAATQQMLDDAFFDVETWLAGEIAEEFARAEGAAFITGDGNNKPTGFLTGTPVVTADASRTWGVLQYRAGGNASTMPTSADTFISMAHDLKAGHRQGASWMMNKATLALVRQYKDTTNQYLWQPSLQAGVPSTFLGYGVVEAEDMPNVGANTFPIAFGDFAAGYLIVDRMGVRTLRDPYSTKPFIFFYTTKRVGGVVQNSEAIKVLRIATS